MPETAEKPKFLLLEAILDLLDKKIDQNRLKEVLNDARTSLADIRQGFESDNNELEPQVREAVEEEARMVRKFFTDWDNAFTAIEKYFSTHVEFDLISAGEMAKRSSEGLNFALDCYTNMALMAMGPTDIPRLNLLIRCVEEVRDGATTHKLERILADEFITIEAAKKELEFEKNLFKFPEQDLMIQAYSELQEGITKLGHATQNGSEELLEQGIKETAEAYPKVKGLVPALNYKRMVQAPTKSPVANLLINMIAARRKGSINDQMFVDAVRETEENYRKVKQQFDLMPRDSAYDQEISKTVEGLELFQGAIEDCYCFLDNREGYHLERAEKSLKAAADIFHESQKFFDELAEREGKTPCVRCGNYNLPERKTCVKCGAILPKAAATSQASSTFAMQEGQNFVSLDEGRSVDEDAIPENLQKMFMAVKGVRDGEITVEEFEETIYWLQDIMEQSKESGFAPMPAVNLDSVKEDERELTQRMLDDTTEIKQLFEEGYRDWEEGLDYFLEFVETNDNELLNKGVQIMMDGNKKLNKLQHMAARMAVYVKEHADAKAQEGQGQDAESEDFAE